MGLQISDWKRACIGGVVLTGLAMTVVFSLEGTESQVGWLFVLLPGSIAAYPLSDYVYKVEPLAEPVAYWILMVTLNFPWYFIVSYTVIKIFRAGNWKLGSPEF
jgi:hypothetical protein